MYISDLKLVNFRNYSNERVEFNKGINIFLGSNAQGKTNLLESVYYCSKGSSFKSNSDKYIIKNGEDFFTLDAQIIKRDRRKLIHIKSSEEKIIKINGIEIDKLDDMKNQFEIVYFLPDHLRIVKDGPNLRRELVDEAIINIRPSFKKLLNNYNKILRQRNAKLKQKMKSKYFNEEISALTIQLINLGSKIVIMRNHYIKILKEKSNSIHSFITEGKENLDIKYSTYLKTIEDENQVKEELDEIFKATLESDIEKGFTTRGPHRDDLNIYINDMNIKTYASQGQQRSSILSIKLGEIEIIKQITSYNPILLLDDVFSELDESRRERLISKLHGIQSLITTNDINFKTSSDMKVFTVKEGKLFCS